MNTQSHLINLLIILLLDTVAGSEVTTTGQPDLDIKSSWKEFKKRYDRQYSSDEDENNAYANFVDNLKFINDHNLNYSTGKVSYKLEMNGCGDEKFVNGVRHGDAVGCRDPKIVTPDDFKEAGMNPSSEKAYCDWRHAGVVTGVRNQGKCGSCWAFATVGALEGWYALIHKKLYQFSPRRLVDCLYRSAGGCDGGLHDVALLWIQNISKYYKEEDYPYHDNWTITQELRADNVMQPTKCPGDDQLAVFVEPFEVNSLHTKKTETREDYMKDSLNEYGPIAAAIWASLRTFTFYSSGIYDDPACNLEGNTDHIMLLVGYGYDEKSKKEYWIMKNSYGKEWGDGGYLYIAKMQGKVGQCGLSTYITYLTTNSGDLEPPINRTCEEYSNGVAFGNTVEAAEVEQINRKQEHLEIPSLPDLHVAGLVFSLFLLLL